MWNGDGDITFKSIGIEVETEEKRENMKWSDEQYKAVEKLVHWIGSRHKIPAAHVLAHSQIAYSKYGRGRKPDPLSLDWSKLRLPNNYLRVDPDVASGAIEANVPEILQEIGDSTAPWYCGSDSMLTGLKAADEIFKNSSVKGIKTKPPKTTTSLKLPPKKDAILKSKSRPVPAITQRSKKKR
jgi:hypothetical protein